MSREVVALVEAQIASVNEFVINGTMTSAEAAIKTTACKAIVKDATRTLRMSGNRSVFIELFVGSGGFIGFRYYYIGTDGVEYCGSVTPRGKSDSIAHDL